MAARETARLGFCEKLLFAGIPLVLFLGTIEVMVRLTGVAESCPGPEGMIWICDPVLYFKTDPSNLVHGEKLNRLGFRAGEFEDKKTGVFRILSLGDSCTFGVTGEESFYVEEPYPQRLESLIANRLGPGKVEVINAGVPGYNSQQGLLLLLSKLRGLKPDLITVRYGWNDHLMSPIGRGRNAFHEPRNPLVRGIRDGLLRTALYPFASRLVLEASALAGGEVTHSDLPEEWIPNMSLEDYSYSLQRIAQVGREQGAAVWFLAAPHGR